MNFTWITQGSFLFESDGFRLAIDPYLSDFVEKEHGLTRLREPALSVATLRPDGVFCTHNHIDHFDPVSMPQLAETYLDCTYAGPRSVVEKCREFMLPMDQVSEVAVGEKVEMGPFVLTALPAIHSDEYAVGVLVDIDGKRIFLSGDSEYSDSYAESITSAAGGVDLALICINGRLGNMDDEEALKVIRTIMPKQALPMHYGLFAENTADPATFIAGCNKMGVTSFEMEQGHMYKL